MDSSPALDDLRPQTQVAIQAVGRGLEVARGRAGATAITSKGGRDLVTETDVAVEDEIRRIVEVAAPYPVVGEERGGDAPSDGSAYWLVDPICGTRNFASGIPLFSVNLALVEHDEIALAVVGDASNDEIQFAERGGGAWADEAAERRRLSTSVQSQTIVVEPGLATGPRRAHAARFAQHVIGADCWDIRSLSSTLSLSYVAAGRVAAYVLFSGLALHTGAGSLLVTEAGGTISDIDGAPWTTRSDSLVAAADPGLHRELLDLVAAARHDG